MLAAALAGGLVMTGLILFAAELTRKAPPPGTPSGRLLASGRLTAQARRRGLLAVVLGLVMLAVTRWPVAALAAGAAVFFVPRITAAPMMYSTVASPALWLTPGATLRIFMSTTY